MQLVKHSIFIVRGDGETRLVSLWSTKTSPVQPIRARPAIVRHLQLVMLWEHRQKTGDTKTSCF